MNKLDFIGPQFRKKLTKVLKDVDKGIDMLYEIATHDEKTGLYNSKFFKSVLGLELDKAKRGKKLSLIMLDIDHFKKINDKYGHLAGDKILKQLANLLQQKIRKSDIASRFGGEEFLIMLPNAAKEKAKMVAERLRKSVQSAGFKPRITISLGVSEYKKADTINNLINKADSALYRAKKKGRNRVEAG